MAEAVCRHVDAVGARGGGAPARQPKRMKVERAGALGDTGAPEVGRATGERKKTVWRTTRRAVADMTSNVTQLRVPAAGHVLGVGNRSGHVCPLRDSATGTGQTAFGRSDRGIPEAQSRVFFVALPNVLSRYLSGITPLGWPISPPRRQSAHISAGVRAGSALRWILLVKPPRERPRPSLPAPPPPGGRPGSPMVSRPGVPLAARARSSHMIGRTSPKRPTRSRAARSYRTRPEPGRARPPAATWSVPTTSAGCPAARSGPRAGGRSATLP